MACGARAAGGGTAELSVGRVGMTPCAFGSSTTDSLIGSTMLGLRGELDGAVDGEIEGLGTPFHLQIPDTGWYRRTRANALRDNPLADLWLVQPSRDIHLLVINEHLAGAFAPGLVVAVGRFDAFGVAFDGLKSGGSSGGVCFARRRFGGVPSAASRARAAAFDAFASA